MLAMKKTIIYLYLVVFLSIISSTASATTDLFKDVKHITLENGLNVYLAPSEESTTTNIHLEVGLGWRIENKENLGVAHLLEHVLFRDKSLKDEMTYLQVIRESGGQANGSTNMDYTSYFASISSGKGLWLLETFGKMILQPSFEDEYIEKEKSTVELELGRPSPMTEFLGFNLWDKIYPKTLKEPSFWMSEFGVEFDLPYSITEEQLINRRLQKHQVVNAYNNYYYPSNMTLFVAGNFDEALVLDHIRKIWGSVIAKSGKKMPKHLEPHPRQAPYIRKNLMNNMPYVYLGTKFHDLSLLEEEVLKSYTEYLSHRLMKQIRNMKGQTYTSRAWNNSYYGFGYAGVEFQTPSENFNENVFLVKDMISKEVINGEFSDEDKAAAVNLYLSQYDLIGRDGEKMMWLAQTYRNIVERNKSYTSPLVELKNISSSEYNLILKKIFNPKYSYEYYYVPYLFFHYDIFLFYAIVAISTFFIFRRFLTKPFKNDGIRWVRKVKYPPLKVVEVFATLGVVIIFLKLSNILQKIFLGSYFIQSYVGLSAYLYGGLLLIIFVVTAQAVYSFLPKKLMVVDDKLVVKSITYYSNHISLDDISRVETKRILMYPFPLRLWIMRVGFRCFFMDSFFWKKGLLIHLKSKKSYFFSFKNADQVCQELRSFLDGTKKRD